MFILGNVLNNNSNVECTYLNVSRKRRSLVSRVYTIAFECIFGLVDENLPAWYTVELIQVNLNNKKDKISVYSLRTFNLVTCRLSQFLTFALK